MRRGGATEPLLDAVDGRVEAEATKQAMVLVRQRCLLLLPLQLLGCSAVWWVVHFVWICSSSSSYRSAVIDPLRGRQQHGVAAQGILASSSRRPPFRCAAEEEQVLQLPLLAAATLHRGGGRTRGLAQAVFLLSSSPWREGLRPSPGLGRSSREGRKESPLSLSPQGCFHGHNRGCWWRTTRPTRWQHQGADHPLLEKLIGSGEGRRRLLPLGPPAKAEGEVRRLGRVDDRSPRWAGGCTGVAVIAAVVQGMLGARRCSHVRGEGVNIGRRHGHGHHLHLPSLRLQRLIRRTTLHGLGGDEDEQQCATFSWVKKGELSMPIEMAAWGW